MNSEGDVLYTVPDPKSLAFDITVETDFLRKLLARLAKLNNEEKDKKFASLFYQRYILGISCEEISKRLNLPLEDVYSRILDVVKYVNKEN